MVWWSDASRRATTAGTGFIQINNNGTITGRVDFSLQSVAFGKRQRLQRRDRRHVPAFGPAPESGTVAAVHAVLETDLVDDTRITRRRHARDDGAGHIIWCGPP